PVTEAAPSRPRPPPAMSQRADEGRIRLEYQQGVEQISKTSELATYRSEIRQLLAWYPSGFGGHRALGCLSDQCLSAPGEHPGFRPRGLPAPHPDPHLSAHKRWPLGLLALVPSLFRERAA